MITYRWYDGTYEEFNECADSLRDMIRDEGFEIDNVTTEFSIYDTKVTHDAAWINREALEG